MPTPSPLSALNSPELLSLIWNQAPLGLALLDASGALELINPELEALLGLNPKEIRFLDTHEKSYSRSLGDLNNTQLLLHAPRPIPVRVTSFGLENRLLLIIQNNAQAQFNKTLQGELAANEHIRLKAGSLAHDLNNLLTAILGNISLAMMHVSKEGKAQNMLEVAHQAGTRSQSMIRQLLTLSKQNAETREPIDIGQALRESAQLLERGAPCAFKINIEPELWRVQANVGQISQVFNNLIINAIHASKKGDILELSARCIQEAGQNAVQIDIQDHGTGIDPQHLPRLFEPYFTTKKTGSGLGLSSVKSLVEDHGGRIEVASTLGKGTIMTLILPGLQEKSGTLDAPAHEPQKPVLLRSGQGRILLMDDEPVIQQIGTEMLKHLNYEVTLATDGQEALDLYKKALGTPQAFSAVILDLAIPEGKGGREIIEPLNRLDPNVVALVSTGYNEDPMVKDPKKYGFTATLSKPYTLQILGETLAQALGNDGTIELPHALKRKAQRA